MITDAMLVVLGMTLPVLSNTAVDCPSAPLQCLTMPKLSESRRLAFDPSPAPLTVPIRGSESFQAGLARPAPPSTHQSHHDVGKWMSFFEDPAIAHLSVSWWAVDSGASTSFGSGQTFSKIIRTASSTYSSLSGPPREKFVEQLSGKLQDYSIGLHESAKAVDAAQASRLVLMFGSKEVVHHFLENYGPPERVAGAPPSPRPTPIALGWAEDPAHPPRRLSPTERWTEEPYQPELPPEFGTADLLSTAKQRDPHSGFVICARLLEFAGVEGRVLAMSSYGASGSNGSTIYLDASRLEVWGLPTGEEYSEDQRSRLEGAIIALLGQPGSPACTAPANRSSSRQVEDGKYSMSVPDTGTVSELILLRSQTQSVMVSGARAFVMHPQIPLRQSGGITAEFLR